MRPCRASAMISSIEDSQACFSSVIAALVWQVGASFGAARLKPNYSGMPSLLSMPDRQPRATARDRERGYCFSGTVIGLPDSATITTISLAGSVVLAFRETACSAPGGSWKVSPFFSTTSGSASTLNRYSPSST